VLPCQGTAKQTAPIAAYYRGTRRIAVNANDVMAVLRCAMMINYSKMGIKATEISACYIRAGGAMAMFSGRIDLNSIRMMGRWHSDGMMSYLHIQAQLIINKYAVCVRVYNRGTYTFLLDETVPIIDTYGDD
jgi:ABC-type microcin C transport system permease subunit YejE